MISEERTSCSVQSRANLAARDAQVEACDTRAHCDTGSVGNSTRRAVFCLDGLVVVVEALAASASSAAFSVCLFSVRVANGFRGTRRRLGDAHGETDGERLAETRCIWWYVLP